MSINVDNSTDTLICNIYCNSSTWISSLNNIICLSKETYICNYKINGRSALNTWELILKLVPIPMEAMLLNWINWVDPTRAELLAVLITDCWEELRLLGLVVILNKVFCPNKLFKVNKRKNKWNTLRFIIWN